MANAASSGTAERFLVLDGLRGLAAFAVILDHAPSGMIGALVPGRYLAVDFFFVLSGFVLAHAYGARLGQGGLGPLGFMKVRLIRLYPLYLVGLGLGLALGIIGALKGWTGMDLGDVGVAALFALVFLPAPPIGAGSHLFPFNSPAWSLFFELVANFVYALVARVLSWTVFAVILPVFAALTVFTLFRHADTAGPGWLWEHLDAGFARVMFDFFAGVFIYHARAQLRWAAMPAWAAFVVFLAVIAVPAVGIWRPAFDAFAAIVLMPMLVAFAADAKVSGVAAKVCGTLGLVSYGVYVLHVPLLGWAELVLAKAPGLPDILVVAWLAGGTGLLVWLLDKHYDQPVRRWLSRSLLKRSGTTLAPKHG